MAEISKLIDEIVKLKILLITTFARVTIKIYLDPDQSTTDLISSIQVPVHVVFVCMLCYLHMAAWKKRSMTGTTSLEEKYKAKIYTGCLSLLKFFN